MRAEHIIARAIERTTEMIEEVWKQKQEKNLAGIPAAKELRCISVLTEEKEWLQELLKTLIE